MFIEEYFEQIREAIAACTAVESFQLTEAKRDSYTGFLRGRVYFPDGSLLHLREFVYVITEVERDMYSYRERVTFAMSIYTELFLCLPIKSFK